MSSIIVVDNDAAMHEIFNIIFEKEYEVHCLSEGSLILTGAMKAPGLFVLDRQLPSAEGLELCRFIKNSPQYQTVPVLLLSAWPNSGELAAEAGVDSVIAKPFCLNQLKTAVRQLLKAARPSGYRKAISLENG
ncbi:MAG TPA: response regulator [Niabella sp.]|nr:response regulator [Niabella sp.]